jgi:hypothetical protein
MKPAHLLLPALLLAVAPAYAQQTPVTSGQRVRVTTEAAPPTRGTVLRADTAGLAVDRGVDTVFTPWREVRRLERSGGGSRLGTGLRYGAIGLAAGAVSGAVLGHVTFDEQADTWDYVVFSRGEAALLTAAALGTVGGAAGFLAGVIFPRERWRPTELPVRVSADAAPAGGVRLTGQLRL